MTYRKQAKRLIKLYTEGSDITNEQSHVLYDTSDCVGQILDNIVHTKVFENMLTENIEALGGINEKDLT